MVGLFLSLHASRLSVPPLSRASFGTRCVGLLSSSVSSRWYGVMCLCCVCVVCCVLCVVCCAFVVCLCVLVVCVEKKLNFAFCVLNCVACCLSELTHTHRSKSARAFVMVNVTTLVTTQVTSAQVTTAQATTQANPIDPDDVNLIVGIVVALVGLIASLVTYVVKAKRHAAGLDVPTITVFINPNQALPAQEDNAIVRLLFQDSGSVKISKLAFHHNKTEFSTLLPALQHIHHIGTTPPDERTDPEFAEMAERWHRMREQNPNGFDASVAVFSNTEAWNDPTWASFIGQPRSMDNLASALEKLRDRESESCAGRNPEFVLLSCPAGNFLRPAEVQSIAQALRHVSWTVTVYDRKCGCCFTRRATSQILSQSDLRQVDKLTLQSSSIDAGLLLQEAVAEANTQASSSVDEAKSGTAEPPPVPTDEAKRGTTDPPLMSPAQAALMLLASQIADFPRTVLRRQQTHDSVVHMSSEHWKIFRKMLTTCGVASKLQWMPKLVEILDSFRSATKNGATFQSLAEIATSFLDEHDVTANGRPQSTAGGEAAAGLVKDSSRTGIRRVRMLNPTKVLASLTNAVCGAPRELLKIEHELRTMDDTAWDTIMRIVEPAKGANPTFIAALKDFRAGGWNGSFEDFVNNCETHHS